MVSQALCQKGKEGQKMKKREVSLSQEELLTIISLLEINEDNDDFTDEERKQFSDLRNKLVEYSDIYSK